MRVKVKVCGITSQEDAALALELGADALGFNFFPQSPRHVDIARAREIISRLPPLAATVGVFVNVEDTGDLDHCARMAGIQVLQLHGDESADYCRRLDAWPVIKAIRVGADGIREDLRDYSVRAFLMDTRDDTLFGGTGKPFDWALLRTYIRGQPIVLAGGLTPANVAEAIRCVRPYAVDVCSGVEYAPGKKDRAKLIAFMNEVRHAAS